MSYSLIFQRKLIMGHRLYSGLSPKCKVPHGHNEIIKVEIKSKNQKKLNLRDNMLIPFDKAKKTWHHFIDNHLDHSLQLSKDDPLLAYFQNQEKDILPNVVVVYGDPSTEIMCACLMAKLDTFLREANPELYTHKIEIQETPTNTVSLEGRESYKQHLPDDPTKKYWWNKADFSINDFENH